MKSGKFLALVMFAAVLLSGTAFAVNFPTAYVNPANVPREGWGNSCSNEQEWRCVLDTDNNKYAVGDCITGLSYWRYVDGVHSTVEACANSCKSTKTTNCREPYIDVSSTAENGASVQQAQSIDVTISRNPNIPSNIVSNFKLNFKVASDPTVYVDSCGSASCRRTFLIGNIPGLNVRAGDTVHYWADMTLADGSYTRSPAISTNVYSFTFARPKHKLTILKTGVVTVTSAPTGISCGAACNADFDDGSSVTLTANPSTVQFNGCDSNPNAGECLVTMNADKTVIVTLGQAPTTRCTTPKPTPSPSGQVYECRNGQWTLEQQLCNGVEKPADICENGEVKKCISNSWQCEMPPITGGVSLTLTPEQPVINAPLTLTFDNVPNNPEANNIKLLLTRPGGSRIPYTIPWGPTGCPPTCKQIFTPNQQGEYQYDLSLYMGTNRLGNSLTFGTFTVEGTESSSTGHCCVTYSGQRRIYDASKDRNACTSPSVYHSTSCQNIEDQYCDEFCRFEQCRSGGVCSNSGGRCTSNPNIPSVDGVCQTGRRCSCDGATSTINLPCNQACSTDSRVVGYSTPYIAGQAAQVPFGQCTSSPQALMIAWSAGSNTLSGVTGTSGQYVRQPQTLSQVPGQYQCNADEFCVCTFLSLNSFAANRPSPTPTTPGSIKWDDPNRLRNPPTSQPNERDCSQATNATITASFGGAQAAGAGQASTTRLIQAGDSVTITGNVGKVSDQCKGYIYTCRNDQRLECEFHNRFYWTSLGYQDCPAGTTQVHAEGEGRTPNWGNIIGSIVTGVTLGVAGPAAFAPSAAGSFSGQAAALGTSLMIDGTVRSIQCKSGRPDTSNALLYYYMLQSARSSVSQSGQASQQIGPGVEGSVCAGDGTCGSGLRCDSAAGGCKCAEGLRPGSCNSRTSIPLPACASCVAQGKYYCVSSGDCETDDDFCAYSGSQAISSAASCPTSGGTGTNDNAQCAVACKGFDPANIRGVCETSQGGYATTPVGTNGCTSGYYCNCYRDLPSSAGTATATANAQCKDACWLEEGLAYGKCEVTQSGGYSATTPGTYGCPPNLYCNCYGNADGPCASRGGTCQTTSTACSGGSYVPNMCGGAANRQCCLSGGTTTGGTAISGGGTINVNADRNTANVGDFVEITSVTDIAAGNIQNHRVFWSIFKGTAKLEEGNRACDNINNCDIAYTILEVKPEWAGGEIRYLSVVNKKDGSGATNPTSGYKKVTIGLTGSGTISASENPISLTVGQTKTITMSGGDIGVALISNSAIANIPSPPSGNNVLIRGVSAGSTKVRVGPTPSNYIEIPVTVTAASDGAATYRLTVAKSGTGKGTITSSPSGVNCAPQCSGLSATFTAGRSVTLTATPGQDSIFVDWGGACSGSGTCTITMNSDRQLVAAFDSTTSDSQSNDELCTNSGSGNSCQFVTNACNGVYMGGRCSGASSRQCCTTNLNVAGYTNIGGSKQEACLDARNGGKTKWCKSSTSGYCTGSGLNCLTGYTPVTSSSGGTTGSCSNIPSNFRAGYENYKATIQAAISANSWGSWLSTSDRTALVAGVISQESSWDPRNGDRGESYGLMQIHYAIHPECSIYGDVRTSDEANIKCGVRILASISKKLDITAAKTYACKGVTYSGIDAVLRYYNGWPSGTLSSGQPNPNKCSGDPDFVENVRNNGHLGDWRSCLSSSPSTGNAAANPTFDVTGMYNYPAVDVASELQRQLAQNAGRTAGTAARPSFSPYALAATYALSQVPVCPSDEDRANCFSICGKTYQTPAAAAPVCDGPVLAANQTTYKCQPGVCGGYENKQVKIIIKGPDGSTAIDDTTTTDGNGDFSYTFVAPAADGEFTAIISVPKS